MSRDLLTYLGVFPCLLETLKEKVSDALCKELFTADPNYLTKDCAEVALTFESASQV